MTAVFVWTLGDVAPFIFFVLLIAAGGVLYAFSCISEAWRNGKKKEKEMTPTERIKETIRRIDGSCQAIANNLAREDDLPELREFQDVVLSDQMAWMEDLQKALKEIQ